ncbi:hypothetical protein COV06_03190 [Candidatus Uhrbacteria bacterium CG10_big_fil_rev_8_21_14_0_10_50_16]|uniref:Thioredoxin domain-containing protein n=1 Tax=Candidatus Uhrbacteria bacterium CG10_big_fil_rev_8_21_14_0_10_50_16 TaxID=1975039 RepID=A0A2H0RLX2_9BACT|nr:MAG: hypothetical protein COV06_03190 [Candidatus Uhrbacteria bacterium CG10_big_fil_rev_8_21_14_0_10_50_16]
MNLRAFGKNLGLQAPEFPKGIIWLNTEPLTLKQLRGKIVLIDFWTYSCVNCLNVMPHLRRWHKLYAKKGLVVIGVHTPEFAFEKDVLNVETAVKEFDLTYPVAIDSESKIWEAYNNHWWPRLVLINKAGQIAFDHVGEGGYVEIEKEIQKALRGVGAKALPKIERESKSSGGVCFPTTPEIYLGFSRGHFKNSDVEANHCHNYKRVSDQRDTPSLEGEWTVREGYVESHGGKIHLPFMAGSINLVAQTSDGEKQRIAVVRDGNALATNEAGDDIVFDGDDSVIFAREPRMYRLLAASAHLTGVLTLNVPSGVRLYSLTFGSACE